MFPARRHAGRREGFTLVEVLVVLAIIAVAVAFLLPALAGARAEGRAAVCSSNLRQVGLANDTYAADHHDQYAPGAPDFLSNLRRWHGSRETPSARFSAVDGTLTPYLEHGSPGSERGVRVCPEFASVLDALGERGFERSCGGYGYNQAFVGSRRKRAPDASYPLVTDRLGGAVGSFVSPSATVAFGDAAFATGEGEMWSDKGAGTQTGERVIEYSFVEPRFWPDFEPAGAPRADPSVHFRHRGQAAVAWLDGHVSPQAMGFSTSSGLYESEPWKAGIGWPGREDSNALYDTR